MTSLSLLNHLARRYVLYKVGWDSKVRCNGIHTIAGYVSGFPFYKVTFTGLLHFLKVEGSTY